MNSILSLEPFINENANFNKSSELGKNTTKTNVNFDYSLLKITRKAREEPSIRSVEKVRNIISVLHNYSNANRILQIGFIKRDTLNILGNIDKKNTGNIKVTCVDNRINIEDKLSIDYMYPFQFEFIYNSIFHIKDSILNRNYNMIFISIKMRDNEIYNLVTRLSNHYNVQIVILEIETLNIIRYIDANFNIIISEIIKNKNSYTVDMKFSETETKKYPYFDFYEKISKTYTLEE